MSVEIMPAPFWSKLFTRLRAARLDNTLDAEISRLARVDLLVLDAAQAARHH
ncbi:MAG TPA: hypothetical protein VII33_18170 [Nakamurella sp.]